MQKWAHAALGKELFAGKLHSAKSFLLAKSSLNLSSNRVIGNLPVIVKAFKWRKSTQSLQVLSFFLTSSTGEENGFLLGWMISLCNISLIWVSISVLSLGGYLQDLRLNSLHQGSRVLHGHNFFKGEPGMAYQKQICSG